MDGGSGDQWGFAEWVRRSGGFVGVGLRNGFSRFRGWVWWDATKSDRF